ncbi:unnamed protein product [Enterobius vermicularis]|uniref:E3 UFM1-protein ligase 1 homolog n=1 Tax=Enterobius vermicularis TaxID=51028 RepID=A0A0N4V9S9_ENTVE|nr:unnamed protein product [Enterobius vermicularis]
MAATWADIQKLAADLQRVQLAGGAKRLSEKNCVEVVSMLLAAKEIDIVFTVDGREYLTKKHLVTEVKNECIGNGGRVSLSELAHTLNVNYEHIEEAVQSILKQTNSFELCNAELISKFAFFLQLSVFNKDYVHSLYKKMNETLQSSGVLSISQIAKTWDLPSEILNNLVLKEISANIDAIQDGDKIYTKTYLKSQKNLLRAVLNSLTRVTSISRIMPYLNLSMPLFWRLYDELSAEQEIFGTVQGGRSSYHAYFVPVLYTYLVKSFVKKTFERENLLEVSTFSKLAVSDPVGMLKEVFSQDEYSSLIFFPSVIVSESRWGNIVDEVTEEMKKQHFADVYAHLPPSFSTDEDVEKAISMCLHTNKDWRSVSGLNMIYEQQLLVQALRALDKYISEKAATEAVLWERKSKLMTKAERQKLDSESEVPKSKRSKGGRGRAGRQSAKDVIDSEPGPASVDFEDIKQNLEALGNFPLELLDEITEQILDTVAINLKTRIESILQNSRSVSIKEEKQSHAVFKENMQNLYDQICMFEDGSSAFPEEDCERLSMHLFKTLCTDAANLVLSFVRDDTISAIENPALREAVSQLFLSVGHYNFESFHDSLAKISSPALCSISLKTPDKKRRSWFAVFRNELVRLYAEGLEKRLEECADSATGLLVALLLIFARKHIAVHATGKFVSRLIKEVLFI